MANIVIEGGYKLSGKINISGAKNSAVALIPAAILCDEKVTISNVPNISDKYALDDILKYLGAKINDNGESITIDPTEIVNKEIPESISKKLRASYYFMSSLLGKYKKVSMYFPGGCAIGARPIDQTIKGFEALGAKIIKEGSKYTIYADKLTGGNVYLDMPSVGATINTILVAVRAEGKTIIENAAKEPEIVNVATFLNNMGAKITGAGTSEIKIEGVDKLHSCFIEVIPDRIETGTYMIASALIGEKVRIENVIPEHVEALTLKLKEAGVEIETGEDYIIVSSTNKMKAINIKTMGFPGFPTDLQQPMSTFLTQCDGISTIHETIYENRFKNLDYLKLMGSNIKTEKDKAYIEGKIKLKGTFVEATDLRAGACLIIAGLIAEGKTVITNIEHILRGYSNIIEKLQNIGAKIKIE